MADEPDILTLLDKIRELAADRSGELQLTLRTSGVKLRLSLGGTGTTNGVARGKLAEPVWNKPGHGVVAFVARDVLQAQHPVEWDKIDAIMQADPAGRASVDRMARFPDDAKSDPEFHKKTGMLHYIDILWQADKPLPDAPAFPEEPHALSAIEQFKKQLVEATDPEEKGDALGWLMHLVGDLHQPLHCSARATDEHPDGDKGGNAFKVKGVAKNLHALWDGLLASEGATPTTLAKLAATIADSYPESSFSEAELKAPPERWAIESLRIAVNDVYTGIDEGDTIKASSDYMKKAKDIARKRAALGGYRLARLLLALAAEL